ncbi:MAG TPA: hypothetical protein VF443_14905 [Nitrospira sp.]
MKAFLRQWETRSPGCSDSIAAAIANVAPALLMDQRLFDFQTLRTAPDNNGEGDAWLDAETYPPQ